jgi:hypothetical protein
MAYSTTSLTELRRLSSCVSHSLPLFQATRRDLHGGKTPVYAAPSRYVLYIDRTDAKSIRS